MIDGNALHCMIDGNTLHCMIDGKGKSKEEKEQKTIEPGSINEPGAHQALAVLGIALIAMGEEIGAEMALRTFNHLVSHVTIV